MEENGVGAGPILYGAFSVQADHPVLFVHDPSVGPVTMDSGWCYKHVVNQTVRQTRMERQSDIWSRITDISNLIVDTCISK